MMGSGVDGHARFKPPAGADSTSTGNRDATAALRAPTLLLLREWLLAVSADAHRAEVSQGGPRSGDLASACALADLDPAG